MNQEEITIAPVAIANDFSSYTVSQTADWARSQNCSPSSVQYILNNGVTGQDMLAANEEQMKSVFGDADGVLFYRSLETWRNRRPASVHFPPTVVSPNTMANPSYSTNPNVAYVPGPVMAPASKKKKGLGMAGAAGCCFCCYEFALLSLAVSTLVMLAIALHNEKQNEDRLDDRIDQVNVILRANGGNVVKSVRQDLYGSEVVSMMEFEAYEGDLAKIQVHFPDPKEWDADEPIFVPLSDGHMLPWKSAKITPNKEQVKIEIFASDAKGQPTSVLHSAKNLDLLRDLASQGSTLCRSLPAISRGLTGVTPTKECVGVDQKGLFVLSFESFVSVTDSSEDN